MSTKEPITLDECCRYVGLYLHNWALMESNLNELLEKAFGIDALQGLILTRNIQFRDKIHIARTIVDLYFPDDKYKKIHKATLQRIAESSTDRNTVAHDLFGPPDDPKLRAVRFLVVKAKGSLSMPETYWTEKDFTQKTTQLRIDGEQIKQIQAGLTGEEYISPLIEALLNYNSSKDDAVQADHHSRPPQSDLDSGLNQATEQTNPQTPEDQKEKDGD